MKMTALSVTTIALLLAVAFGGGAWLNSRLSALDPVGRTKGTILHYVDPMNPSHTSREPGIAPCGMPMEPVYAHADPSVPGHSAPYLPPGSVRISPERQQIIGVRLERVEMSSASHTLRLLGRVAADENRIHRIIAGDAGWVWHVHGGATGSVVDRDQLIATIYNYQFLTRQQQFLYALGFEERRRKPPTPPPPASTEEAPTPGGHRPSWEQPRTDETRVPEGTFSMVPTTPGGGMNPAGTAVYTIRDQLEVARLELLSLGVGEYQIQEIERSRQLATNLEIRSPVRGIVLSRDISPGQRFDKGVSLFEIADLSRVWVLADVFESEASHVAPGHKAIIHLPRQGRRFDALVADAPPVFDPTSRSFKVRLEVDNPDLALRPNMFVDVELQLQFDPAVTVPVDALLDTGQTRTVFVEAGSGYFEPRTVETGRRLGGQVEIVRGVMPGERIVVSSNFLVDSESRMKRAAAGLHEAPARDPVCGMPVNPGHASPAGLVTEHGGKTHFFCAPQCKQAFDAQAQALARHDGAEHSMARGTIGDGKNEGGVSDGAPEPVPGANGEGASPDLARCGPATDAKHRP
jgi:YHS domain-containing protein